MKRHNKNFKYLVMIFVALVLLIVACFLLSRVSSREAVQENVPVVKINNSPTLSQTEYVEAYEASLQTLKKSTTTDLKTLIISGVSSLQKSNNQKLNLYIMAALEIYVSRVPNDVDIENMSGVLLDLFGPCWGIPMGQCRE